MKSLVILPTYNEAENLPRIVPEIMAAAPLDVLVVDDASPDGTGDLARALSQKNPKIHSLHRPAKQGLGSAYVAGFRWALERGYDAVIQMDCDFSHAPSDLPKLLGALDGGADLALGSRYVPGGRIEGWAKHRLLISAAGNWYARTVLNLSVQDLTGGFKAWKRKALQTLDLDHVLSDGYAFQIETTTRALKRGMSVAEVPIVFHERRFGRSKLSRRIIWEAFWLVWRL